MGVSKRYNFYFCMNTFNIDDVASAFSLVSNLALVKPDKAKAVENYLIQMARIGQLGGKVRCQMKHH